MKKLLYAALLTLLTVCYTACESYETYGDKKDKERAAISRFITDENIQVIDEIQFEDNGYVTDTSKNEFVRLTRTGVYMQIVRKGCGDMLEENRRVNVFCRFMEKNLLTDSVLVRNDVRGSYYIATLGMSVDPSQYVDKMSVIRTGTTITASFTSTESMGGMMEMVHGSASVPSGWLVPLNYINIGRPVDENDQIAKVRLIVPHSQGTADASSSVYPCYYEITYVREK